jgi:hypothetical protein
VGVCTGPDFQKEFSKTKEKNPEIGFLPFLFSSLFSLTARSGASSLARRDWQAKAIV